MVDFVPKVPHERHEGGGGVALFKHAENYLLNGKTQTITRKNFLIFLMLNNFQFKKKFQKIYKKYVKRRRKIEVEKGGRLEANFPITSFEVIFN